MNAEETSEDGSHRTMLDLDEQCRMPGWAHGSVKHRVRDDTAPVSRMPPRAPAMPWRCAAERCARALSVPKPILCVLRIDSVAQKCREAGGAAGPRKEFRKAVVQRLRRRHFPWRRVGADGAQPGAEMPPYQSRILHGEIVQNTLGNAADLDEAVIRVDLAPDGLPVGVRFAVWMQPPRLRGVIARIQKW